MLTGFPVSRTTLPVEVDVNIQEILNNLSGLEAELQNIKSARVMAEETISSYRDTQKEVSKLTERLSDIGAFLRQLVNELKKQDTTLSEKINETVGKLDQKCLEVNHLFQDECNKTSASFNEKTINIIDNIRKEITELSGAFEKGNNIFTTHLNRL